MSVLSHLGEPLKLSIPLSDFEKTPDVSCFKVSEANHHNPFKSTELSIKSNGNQHQLFINTADEVSEPILNLQVDFKCEPNLTRDYLILLDINTASEVNASTPALDLSSNATDIKPEKAVTGKPKREKTREIARPRLVKTKPQSRLSISGGGYVPYSESKLSLRFERNINTQRAELAESLPTDNDVSDQATAIINRVENLERQIFSLRDKNELLQANAKNKEQRLATVAKQLNLAIISSVTLLILLVLALFHRQINHFIAYIKTKIHSEKEHFFTPDDEVDADFTFGESKAPIPKDKSQSSYAEESLKIHSQQAFNHESLSITDKNPDVDILESIDVFMEYGRPLLAIQLLSDYLKTHPQTCPTVWLKLASLLASFSTEESYNKFVEDFSARYQIKMPGFFDFAKVNEVTLDDYPEIKNKIISLGKSKSLVTFINDLIITRPNEQQIRFEREVFRALVTLKHSVKDTDLKESEASEMTSGFNAESVTNAKATPAVEADFHKEPDLESVSSAIPEGTDDSKIVKEDNLIDWDPR